MTHLEARLFKRQVKPAGVIDLYQRHCHDVGQQAHTNRLMQRLGLVEKRFNHYTGGILQSGAIAQRFNVSRVEQTDWDRMELEWRVVGPSEAESISSCTGTIPTVRPVPTSGNDVPSPVSNLSVRVGVNRSELVIKPLTSEFSPRSINSSQFLEQPLTASMAPLAKQPLSEQLAVHSPAMFRLRRTVPHSTEILRSEVNRSQTDLEVEESGLPPLWSSTPEVTSQNLVQSQPAFSFSQGAITQELAASGTNTQLTVVAPTLRVKAQSRAPFVERSTRRSSEPFEVSSSTSRTTSQSLETRSNPLLTVASPATRESVVDSTSEVRSEEPLPLALPVAQAIAQSVIQTLTMNSQVIQESPVATLDSTTGTGHGAMFSGEVNPGVNPHSFIYHPATIEKVADQVGRLLSRRSTMERQRRGIRP